MPTGFFDDIASIKYEGPESANPLAFRHYDAGAEVQGKSQADHLRFAVAYWHSFRVARRRPIRRCKRSSAPGSATRWRAARLKADVAFELFEILGAPYFCFHDLDVRPEGDSFAESEARLDEITDLFGIKMEATGVKLLWGTANMFTHRRWMSGASTNPDPDVFAYAAATVKSCMDATQKLGGENYVLWGGREGYETLLNTNVGAELDHMGRFLNDGRRLQAQDRLQGHDPGGTETAGTLETPV